MPAIENPMSSAPEMASITMHDSRLNLSVMDVQRLARMEDPKNAGIFYVQKDLEGLWRQVRLDEVRTTKCLELLQQLAKELSPPAEKVPIDLLRTEQDQTSAIKPKLALSDVPSELGLDLTCPKILLPPAYMNPRLRLKSVFPTSRLILKLVLTSRVCTDVGLRSPPSGLGVALPKVVSSGWTPTAWDFSSVFRISQTGHPKVLMPESVDLKKPEPVELKKPEPIDVSKPELPSHIKKHPRVQAIEEKMATQLKVCADKEIRAKEASVNTNMRYGPWVKAIKKAGKDLKIEKGKLKKLRHEEERILAEIGD